MVTVVFACVHNAGRSQIAAGFFNQLVDPNKACAISAGTNPLDQVHLRVKIAMSEAGVDLTHECPKKLTSELAKNADYLITMGCKEKCPYTPNATIIDWPFEDPSGKELTDVRIIRDKIKTQVISFLAERIWLS